VLRLVSPAERGTLSLVSSIKSKRRLQLSQPLVGMQPAHRQVPGQSPQGNFRAKGSRCIYSRLHRKRPRTQLAQRCSRGALHRGLRPTRAANPQGESTLVEQSEQGSDAQVAPTALTPEVSNSGNPLSSSALVLASGAHHTDPTWSAHVWKVAFRLAKGTIAWIW